MQIFKSDTLRYAFLKGDKQTELPDSVRHL